MSGLVDESAAKTNGHACPIAAERGADAPEKTDSERLGKVIEALLLAAEGPLSIDQLQRLLAIDDPGIERGTIRSAMVLMGERLQYGASELVEVAGGWRLQVRECFASQVARLWQEKPPRLSRALLETLALIIYRQPVTRGEIEQVRGVSVSTYMVNTLLDRGWIRVLGHKEVPGRPALYGTTSGLLDDLGLKTLDQLPELPAVQDPEQLDAALTRLGVTASAAVDDESVLGEVLQESSDPGDFPQQRV